VWTRGFVALVLQYTTVCISVCRPDLFDGPNATCGFIVSLKCNTVHVIQPRKSEGAFAIKAGSQSEFADVFVQLICDMQVATLTKSRFWGLTKILFFFSVVCFLSYSCWLGTEGTRCSWVKRNCLTGHEHRCTPSTCTEYRSYIGAVPMRIVSTGYNRDPLRRGVVCVVTSVLGNSDCKRPYFRRGRGGYRSPIISCCYCMHVVQIGDYRGS
jgi:hypothetical protein